jgi:imidazolonepropionase-like amidohydrolase
VLRRDLADQAAAGLSRAAALGAACWTARSWLGLPGLADGAPADLEACISPIDKMLSMRR